MKHRWAAPVFVLALVSLLASAADAQSSATPASRGGTPVELGQNFPNPFNPETKIPFTLGDAPACQDGGRIYTVSLRIFNVLAQPVATPILQGDGAPAHVAGRPIQELQLPCGTYTAYWDGKFLNTSREVASGIYLYQLTVDGRSFTRKMIVTK